MEYQINAVILLRTLSVIRDASSVLALSTLLSREKQSINLKEMRPVTKGTTKVYNGKP